MAKTEWGTKRDCASCNAHFYDLGENPPVCPKCGTEFRAPARTGGGASHSARLAPKPEPKPARKIRDDEFDDEDDKDAFLDNSDDDNDNDDDSVNVVEDSDVKK